jgi:hypothetical protein
MATSTVCVAWYHSQNVIAQGGTLQAPKLVIGPRRLEEYYKLQALSKRDYTYLNQLDWRLTCII